MTGCLIFNQARTVDARLLTFFIALALVEGKGRREVRVRTTRPCTADEKPPDLLPGFSAVNAALRFQIYNCLRHAERFMENPRAVIMETRRNGASPAGMIGAVAYGLESINPQLASQPYIIAAEIEGIAATDTAEKGWPYRAEGIADWTHNLRTMIEAIRADLDHPTSRPV